MHVKKFVILDAVYNSCLVFKTK